MKIRTLAVCSFAVIAFLLVSGLSGADSGSMQGPSKDAAGFETRLDAGTQQEAPQVEMPQGAGVEYLRVFSGRSLVIRSPEPLKRVSVTDEQIAYAVIVAPDQVVIHGLKPGSVTLLLWTDKEEMRSFGLEVLLDLRPLRDTMRKMFPTENIEISQSGSSLLLNGTVSSQEIVDRALAIAKTEAASAVNLMTVAVVPNKVVLLQVRFAEVDRNALQQLGLNIISTGALNTIGATTTGQFSPPASQGGVGGGQGSFQLSDLLNIFVFRPDLNLALTIKALEQRNFLQILAEPNLLAVGGKEASFLAGGEFPVPIVQGGTGIQTVTVQFKEFGVRLKFIADPQPDGLIRLKVGPEVSSLDYANAVTLSGFTIPALTTRKAETEVELRDGQSFAIAGLIDKRLTQISSKIPWLGDVPFLGKLFQSREFKQSNSELLVMVTPHLVKPLEPGEVQPGLSFPQPFIDNERFDGKKSEVQTTGGEKKPSK
jgi:pilus assembly protein CpaC